MTETTKENLMNIHDNSNPWDSEGGGVQCELHKGWQDLLESYEWSHVATLTFKYDAAPWKAMHEFYQWVRHLDRRTQHKVYFFVVMERTHADAVHLHAFLNVVGDNDYLWDRSWRPGLSKVERYRPGGGWAGYITKGLTKDDTYWDWDPPQGSALP